MLSQQTILDIISQVNHDFAENSNPVSACERFLHTLVTATKSESGFMADVLPSAPATPLLQLLTAAGAPPDNAMLQYYGAQMGKEGTVLSNTLALFGRVAITGKPLLSNNVADDENNAGFSGTPASLHTFIGFPLIYNNTLTAILCLFNNRDGYDTALISQLEPVLMTCSSLLYASRHRDTYERMRAASTEMMSDLVTLTAALDDIVFEMNDQKVFTKVWCRDEEMLFRPPAEVIGKTITEALGKFATPFDNIADAVLRSGLEQEYEYPDIRTSVFRWYRMKMNLIHHPPSSPKKILIRIQNITQRKRNEMALRQANADLTRYNHLLDISQEMGLTGGWELNIVTGEIYWTRQMYVLREVQPEYPVTFEGIATFYHPDDRNTFLEARHNLLHHHQQFCLDLRMITATGRERWVRSLGTPAYTNGIITHFRGIVMDITKEKLQELEINEARLSAEKAAKGRSEFLSVMSHEIRTPLNAIVGIADSLQQYPEAHNPETFYNLRFSANHLLALVNDILDFSKIEAGKVDLENIPFDLAELLQGIAGNYLPQARAKGIKLFTYFDYELPQRITGDPLRLSQILNNLTDNAIKFTSEGAVTIEVKLEDTTDTQYRIRFAVKDTGIGIAPEMQEHIFNSFVQEDSATTRSHGGTGLGLAISRRLVELYQGSISLQSDKGAGATFSFTINFDIPGESQEIQEEETPPPADFLKDMQLLIVEDNSINVRVLQLQLTNSGAQLTVATNGKKALDLMQQQQFDGIILDLHMPEMNGYETIPYIHELQRNAFVIVLTADIMPEVTGRLRALNVTDMLPKPYPAKDLFEILTKYYSPRG
ncbi:MAG TPA: ATP-binding protein [Chitinophaga sp.]|uniref:ATP-binding protein n=1 Tax=Chitinophaga sp. TaxID=1869181 RepID=UPI002C03DE9A|nr:ATP-binding protein [Chitinophaga sp.]HVI47752.1 ATP-binding protein [Chitinophaga sp.]